jgi:hypothetical protein
VTNVAILASLKHLGKLVREYYNHVGIKILRRLTSICLNSFYFRC